VNPTRVSWVTWIPRAMTTSYDPDRILAEANEWREGAAAAVDPAYRDECLQCAARAEDLVKRSLRTLSIKEAGQPERPTRTVC
jgi:hypothetical protein